MFFKKVEKKERRIFRDIYVAIWDFWTSPTGAFILAVSAMALGYYQFYVSRPILRYDISTVKIISSVNNNDFGVKVKDKSYQDLYLTKVYLFNEGEQALSGSDVSKIDHDPIRIVIPKDLKLVHYNIDNDETSSAISATIETYDGNLVLNFDFLNPDYQYVVNLLHENSSDDVKILGSALNVNQITREIYSKRLRHIFLWVLGALYILLIARYVVNKLRRH
jgi:hypothetical protein